MQLTSEQIKQLQKQLNYDLTILTYKDVARELNISTRSASRIILDIKQEYGIKTKVTKQHLIQYLKLH